MVYIPLVAAMRVRIVRRLGIEEVYERLRRLQVAVEAAGEGGSEAARRLRDAYKAYIEEGEVEYLEESELELEGRELSKILTGRRLELLEYLASQRPESINGLARELRRSVKNVYVDLKVLEGLGLVRLRREKNRLIPESTVEELSICFF